MTNAVTAFLFTVLVGTGGVDTTLAVKRGTRLEVDNFAGDIRVRTWAKDAMRIEASHSRRTRVDIDRSSAVIRLTAIGRMMPSSVDYQLTVPTWMPLDLHGMSAEIDVDGTRAAVTAKSINGDVRIKGGAELVTASSLQGEVEVEDTKGRVEVSSTNQGVKLRRIDGDVLAESMNGMIILDRVSARSLEANSINGNIVFVGPMISGGLYSLSTHNGTVLVGLPEKPDVTVTVATFSGDFSSTIPVQMERSRHGKRFNFTLGSGSAKLELESFQGGVRLAKLAELMARLPKLEAADGDDEDHDGDVDSDHDEDTPKDKPKNKDKN